MRVDIEEIKGVVLMVISHGTKRHAMDLSDRTTSRAVYTNMKRTFEYNNTDVWPYISEANQSKIYDLVVAGVTIAGSILPLEQVIISLRGVVSELASLHDEQAIRMRLSLSSRIIMPDSIHESYNHNDGAPGSVEQTYVRSEYIDLLVLSCGLKVVIPIWIEMKYKSHQSVKSSLKEGRLFDILTRSQYINYKGMLKLIRYIRVFMNKSPSDEVRLVNVVAGTGSEDAHRQILAKQVVGTVSVIDPVSGQIPNTSTLDDGEIAPEITTSTQTVISRIYFSVNSMVKTGSRARRGSMVEPKFPAGTNNGDEATSTLEQYRASFANNQGELAAVRYYMENTYVHLEQLLGEQGRSREVVELFETFLDQGRQNKKRSILNCQRRIVKLVYQDLIDPRHIDSLHRKQNICAIAVTQTWLWVKGYYSIAAIVGATPITDTKIVMDNSRVRIKDPAQLHDLNTLFAPSKRMKGKNANAVLENRVATAIMAMNNPGNETSQSGFGSNAWRLHLPEQMRTSMTGHADIHVYLCPNDICVQLASLITSLAK